MTDPNGRTTRAAVALRATILLLFVLLLLWRQAAVGAVAAEALGGGTLTYGALAAATVPVALAGLLLLCAGLLRAILLAGAGLCFSLLLSADIGYLLFFERPFSLELMVLLEQAWSVRESASSLLGSGDVVAVVAIAGLAAGDAVLRRRTRRTWREKVVGLLLLAVAAPPLFGAWRTFGEQDPRLREVFVDLETVRSHGALLYHVADLGRAVRSRVAQAEIGAEREDALLGAVARRHQANRSESPLGGVAAGRSVILLQLESVESFVLGRSVPGGALTPTLDRLREQALAFDRCHDLAAAGRTSDAEFMVATSLPPDPVRPAAYAGTSARYTALPGRLGDDGYRTLSLHAYEPWFWNRAVMHPLYGIRELWFDETFREGERLFLGLGDVDFLTQAAARLARVPRPFFSLCITLSCHHPFAEVPPHLASFETGFEDDSMVDGYLRLVRYTDDAVDAFVRGLQETGLWDDVVLVVYGDHVSGLSVESRRRLSTRLGVDLEPVSAQRLPLLVLVPGREEELRKERARVSAAPCSLMDVAPTVLHLLGREIPAGWLGVHLLAPAAARPVVPLRNGLGFDAGDVVTDEPGEASGSGPWRAAREELRFGEAMRLYDGQARAAALGEEELRALAARAAVSFTDPEEEEPWAVRLEGPARPLSRGGRVLPFLPFPPVPVELHLVLENRAPDAQPYRVDTFTVHGAPAASLAGNLAGGERRELVPSRDASLLSASSFWGRLDAPETVEATITLRSPYGDQRRAVVDETAPRTVLTGSAAGLDLALLIVVNPGSEEVESRVRIEVDGRPTREEGASIGPRSAWTTKVSLDRTDGDVRLTVNGDGLVARVVRFSEGGRRLR